jgi:hypothetical protein
LPDLRDESDRTQRLLGAGLLARGGHLPALWI